MSKNVIILGAGYGGVAAGKKLNKLLKNNPEITITLIDRNPYHTLLTEIHEVAGNRIERDGVEINLHDIFDSTRVNVVRDYIQEIDFENRTLKSKNYEYHYDYLILGTGSKQNNCGVKGVDENAFPLWSIEEAEKINDHIITMFEKARITKDPELRKELLTFSVCGGGFTGVEMVGELVEWMDDLSYQYDIPRDEIKLHLCEGLDRILPNLSEKHANQAMDYLRRKNVKVKLGSFVSEVKEDEIIFADGEEIKTRTVIWNCGITVSDITSKLGLTTDKGGRIKVTKYLQTVDYPEVYAIGDNAAAPWGDEKILPALVEAALQTGDTAAVNVAADITGKEKEEIKPKLHGIMVSIGGRFAVADLMGISLKGWPAMFMKHLVNMHYLFEVGGLKNGLNYISKYIEEQGSHKGLVAQAFDHFSKKSRSFWLAFLRIFLGFMWLSSGLEKVRNGWLVAGDKLVAGASTSPIGPNPVEWYVSFMEAVVFPNALLFQIMITLGELALAVSLIFGIFSVFGALGSLFMTINFFLSGFYPQNPELPWYLIASLTCVGGSSRSLGLDYYIYPWLKKLVWGKSKEKNEGLRKVVKNNQNITQSL